MNAFTSSPSLTTFASAALIAACAMLSACGHAVTMSQAQDSLATMPMSTFATMGPVYFGDTLALGESNATEQTVLVVAARQ